MRSEAVRPAHGQVVEPRGLVLRANGTVKRQRIGDGCLQRRRLGPDLLELPDVAVAPRGGGLQRPERRNLIAPDEEDAGAEWREQPLVEADAVRVTFEVAELEREVAERMGADIEKVRIGIGSDPRIGYSFIYPGAGYGGSCFPKDVKALVHSAGEHQFDAQLLKAVEAVNKRQKQLLFRKIDAYFKGQLAGRTIAVWGLAFKPNTDDMREAPSRDLLEALWAAGAKVRAYDPVAMAEARRIYGERPDLVLVDSSERALDGADALAIVTEWQEFRSPDFERIRDALRQKALFDGRNLYDPALVRSFGLTYHGIGRGEPLFA